MDALRLFTSFGGRIGRIGFLIGITIVLLLSPLALALLFAKTGIIAMISMLGIPGMIWWLLLMWPVTALLLKRLRDRQRPIWWAAIFVIPALIVIVITYSNSSDTASAFIGLLNVALIAIAIWFLIELGFAPGRLPPQTLMTSKTAAKPKPKSKLGRARA